MAYRCPARNFIGGWLPAKACRPPLRPRPAWPRNFSGGSFKTQNIWSLFQWHLSSAASIIQCVWLLKKLIRNGSRLWTAVRLAWGWDGWWLLRQKRLNREQDTKT